MNRINRNAIVGLVLALAMMVGGLVGPLLSHDAGAQVVKGQYREVILQAAAAKTVTGTTATVSGLGKYTVLAVVLNCPTVTGTNPTYDLKIQGSVDGGTVWYDLITFTQVTAATTAVKYWSDVNGTTAQLLPDTIRGSYTIGGTNTPTFTCSLKAAAKG